MFTSDPKYGANILIRTRFLITFFMNTNCEIGIGLDNSERVGYGLNR